MKVWCSNPTCTSPYKDHLVFRSAFASHAKSRSTSEPRKKKIRAKRKSKENPQQQDIFRRQISRPVLLLLQGGNSRENSNGSTY